MLFTFLLTFLALASLLIKRRELFRHDNVHQWFLKPLVYIGLTIAAIASAQLGPNPVASKAILTLAFMFIIFHSVWAILKGLYNSVAKRSFRHLSNGFGVGLGNLLLWSMVMAMPGNTPPATEPILAENPQSITGPIEARAETGNPGPTQSAQEFGVSLSLSKLHDELGAPSPQPPNHVVSEPEISKSEAVELVKEQLAPASAEESGQPDTPATDASQEIPQASILAETDTLYAPNTQESEPPSPDLTDHHSDEPTPTEVRDDEDEEIVTIAPPGQQGNSASAATPPDNTSHEVEPRTPESVSLDATTGQVEEALAQKEPSPEPETTVREPEPVADIEFTITSAPVDAPIYVRFSSREEFKRVGTGTAILTVQPGTRIEYRISPTGAYEEFKGSVTATETALHPVWLTAKLPRKAPAEPRVYSSASGLPAPEPGREIQATPEYVVNFIANELELTDWPCPPNQFSPIICGNSRDTRVVAQALVNSLFEMYLQPASRAIPWRKDAASGSYVAIFERPEGVYGVSYYQGALTIGYGGPR